MCFHFASVGSPTLATEALSVGFVAYISRSDGASRSSVRMSSRLLPRGMDLRVTRMKGSDGSGAAGAHVSSDGSDESLEMWRTYLGRAHGRDHARS
jgi:hypothetical protein